MRIKGVGHNQGIVYLFAVLFMGLGLACGGNGTRTPEPADTETETVYVPDDSHAVPIPQDCDEASLFKTSVGCEFIAVDLSNPEAVPNNPPFPEPPYAVVVANVHETNTASVEVFERADGAWVLLQTVEVAPQGLQVIEVEDYEFSEDYAAKTTGITSNGVYKISSQKSDTPIIAYQFNPLDGIVSYTTDASMLIPTSFWGDEYAIPGWWHRFMEGVNYSAYMVVVAQKDGTELTVNPAFQPRAANSNPGLKQSFEVTLNEGESLYVHTMQGNDGVAGTTVKSKDGKPFAVFTGHECANAPVGNCCCDMLEEQIPPVEALGTYFVAARFPVVKKENNGRTQQTIWQIVAGERNTSVQFIAHPDVKAYLPNGEEFKFTKTRLARAGDYIEIWVDGTDQNPGDFFIYSEPPVTVVQYMQSGNYIGFDTKSKWGDPAITYVPPLQQFLSKYAVLVPASWEEDYFVITREAGSRTLVDGEPLPDSLFKPLQGVPYEIGRYQISEGTEGDGFHIIESEDEKDGLSVIVVGFDNADSYAFPGGMGIFPVNPD